MNIKDNNTSASPLYQLFLLILSLYVLVTLSLEAFVVADPEIKSVLQTIDLYICLFFLADFFISLFRAKNKMHYLRWGWIDLVSSIPMVDPLRWGRLARVVRIVRALRALRSFRVIYASVKRSPFETVSLMIFIVVFFSFTVASSLILEFERGFDSPIKSSSQALWWSFLSILNAKTGLPQAVSPEGVITTVILNKIGLLLFAYINASIIAMILSDRTVED